MLAAGAGCRAPARPAAAPRPDRRSAEGRTPGPARGRTAQPALKGSRYSPSRKRVELIAPLLQGLRHRRADAAALVAQQTQQADGRPAQRQSAYRGRRRRSPAQNISPIPATRTHPRPDDLARADVQVHLRHPIVAGGHQQQSGADQPAGIRPSAEQEADDRHREDRKEPARRHDQPGVQRIVTKQRLKQAGQRRAGAIERSISAKDDDAARSEVAFAQRPEIDHRAAVTQLPKDQPDQAHGKENGQRLHAPERIAQPVPLLALAEHHFPADHDDDQQRQADRVETGTAASATPMRWAMRYSGSRSRA